ncbi:MAG: hypothetical protein R2744_02410 [Bacteroidales bacterium]
MKTESVGSLAGLREAISGIERAYLLLYRAGSESSDCALAALKQVPSIDGIEVVFTADVTNVRDIHPEFGIDSVPGYLRLPVESWWRFTRDATVSVSTSRFFRADIHMPWLRAPRRRG